MFELKYDCIVALYICDTRLSCVPTNNNIHHVPCCNVIARVRIRVREHNKNIECVFTHSPLHFAWGLSVVQVLACPHVGNFGNYNNLKRRIDSF